MGRGKRETGQGNERLGGKRGASEGGSVEGGQMGIGG
jgi:hypothetical protein